MVIGFISINSCSRHSIPQRHFEDKIIFLSNREAPPRQFDIFLMNSDGTGQTNLTSEINNVRSLSNPRVSPDGKTVLYVSVAGSKNQLKLLNISDRQTKVLCNLTHDNPDAGFSPDGSQVVYVDRISGRQQIHLMNLASGTIMNLSANNCDEFAPVFSPAGSNIIFISKCAGVYSIVSMSTGGGSRKILYNEPGKISELHFSPSGDRIVFALTQKGNSDICLIFNDGTDFEKITDSPMHETEPKFSPDGMNIIFISNQRGMKYRDIFRYNLKDGSTVCLTDQLNYINQNASFTADSKFVIFETTKFNDSEIYSVDINGTNLTNLTNNTGWETAARYY